MSELSIFQGSDLPAPTITTDAISKVVKSSEYFPRVQLMTSSAAKCKAGQFPINNFAMIDSKNFVDLGKQVDVAVLDVRLKALELADLLLKLAQRALKFEAVPVHRVPLRGFETARMSSRP